MQSLVPNQHQFLRRAANEATSQASNSPNNSITTTSNGNNINNNNSFDKPNDNNKNESPTPTAAVASETPTATVSSETPKSSDANNEGRVKRKSQKSKSSLSWFNILNPSYKTRQEEFKRNFQKSIPGNERLLCDYSCALQKEILVQGRVYLSVNYFCFYANIFKWETSVVIKCKDITSMTKTNTALVIPNAIQICTNTDKLVFTSFGGRDRSFVMMFRIWQNALLDQPMSSAELWQWVHYSYGDDLGLSSAEEMDEDNDTISKSPEMSSPQLFNEQSDGPSSSESSDEMVDATDNNQNNQQLEMDDDSPVKCLCTSHDGKQLMDEVFQVDVDHAFELMFTDCVFIQNLLKLRKTTDVVIAPWQETTPNKKRQLTYTVTLNHPLIKSASTTETQYLLASSQPGQVYMIISEVLNHGIPYSDNYMVQSQWCLTRVTATACRLQVHGQLVYTKSSWSIGLMRPMIEKSAIEGLSDYCKDLLEHLPKWVVIEQQVCDNPNAVDSVEDSIIGSNDSIVYSKSTAEVDQRVEAVSQELVSSLQEHDAIPRHSSLFQNDSTLLKLILILTVLLLISNLLVFISLWRVESSVQEVRSSYDLFANVPDNLDGAKQLVDKLLTVIRTMESKILELKSKYKDEL